MGCFSTGRESCMQDSLPVAGRFSAIIPLRNSVLLPGELFIIFIIIGILLILFQAGKKEFIEVIFPFKRRGIFSAAIGAAFDFCVKFFTCHGKIHFIDGNAIGMADFAECVDWIRIFPCLKQFFTQNGVCLCFFLPSFCLHCREVLSSP